MLEALEVFVEHLGHFVQVDLVLFLVGPSVLRVQDLGVNTVQGSRVLQVEDGESGELGLGERAIVDGVDDVSSGLDADALNILTHTFP